MKPTPGLAALVLGGSHARGQARPESDLDVGLLYRDAEPLDIAAVRMAAVALNDTPDPVVSDRGGWGRWVDGGAWLTIEGQRVDLLYRSVDTVAATLAEAESGRYEIDWAQQPPFGFFGPTLLGEASIARPLWDPDRIAGDLAERTRVIPEPLVRTVVQDELWGVALGLAAFAPKYAAAGNVFALAGCMTRFARGLVLALFALNRVWLLNDKTALREAAGFSAAPLRFAERLEAVLAAVGREPAALSASLHSMQALFDETAGLAGPLYTPAWRV